MRLHVSPGEGLPLYLQIVRQVEDAVASGALEPGAKLDSQRELAAELVVAPLTVKKAYDELERRGLVETRRGRGTFVRARPGRRRGDARLARLRATARRLVGDAELSGVSFTRLVELLREERARLRKERNAHTRT